MEFLSVIVAAVVTYAFGAFWYIWLAKQWMISSGITKEQIENHLGNKATPFIISAIMLVIVAGMMRHSFDQSGIDTALKGAVSGFGIGAFLATPWIVTNHAYNMKPRMLTVIDGGYTTIGCTIIGLILGLF